MRNTAAVLVLAVVLLAGARLAHRNPPGTQEPAPGSARPVVLGGGALIHARARAITREHEVERALAPAPARATATARRFLSAYLSWQQGNRAPSLLQTLRATTSPELWALLRSGRGQPTRNPRVASEHLAGLTPGQATARAATIIAGLRSRHRALHGLGLVLRRDAGRWHVTALGR